MNDWQARKERQAFRAEVLTIVEAQKAVIGALVRKMDALEREIANSKRPTVTVTRDAESVP
jgi:hypothetical protein